MNLNLQFKINSNELMESYLRENSYFYKYLNRNEAYFDLFVEKMKEDYKLRTKDKITKFTDRLDMFSSFFEVLK